MGKPPARVRYNAKARGSVAGGTLKRGKPKKRHQTEGEPDHADSNADSNMEIIVPLSAAAEQERARLRREALKAEVGTAPVSYLENSSHPRIASGLI